MRRVPVRRRISPTMSWLVGPTGLSRLTTPSIGAVELALAFVEDARHCLGQGDVEGAACGTGVPSPAECRGDRDRIGVPAGADADAHVGCIGLLEHDGDLAVAGRAQKVDEALGGR